MILICTSLYITIARGVRKKVFSIKSFDQIVTFISSFFVTKKLPYVVTRDVCPSVRLSVCPSVCPSSVEISLERGCTITNRPIDLKFGLFIGGREMHV